MKLAPRLLPLVGVAVAGVLALKMTGGVDGLSSLIGARAQAEEASPAKGPKHASALPAHADAGTDAPIQPPGVLPGLPTQTQANAPAVGPAVCAPSATELARQAGLSPAELQVIQNLGARRGQLDAREQALDTQLQLIAAAEQKLNGRIQALNGLKAEIQALVGQVDTQQQAEIDRLVVVYEKMKPKDAGPLMAALDDKVRIPVAAKMKPAALAAILAQMGTAQAKSLSESLARRFSPTQTLQQALEGKPAPEAAKPPPPPPTQTAAAPPAPAEAKAAPAKRRQAKASPRRAKPVGGVKADDVAPAKVAAKPGAEPAVVAASGATSKPAKTAAATPAVPAKAPAGPPA